MTKRNYPYLVVKANNKVSVIHTKGILNAQEMTADIDFVSFTVPKPRSALLVLNFDP